MYGPKAYINKAYFNKNLLNIRKYIGNRNLMLVVKANAYGHGALEIASLIKDKSWLVLCVFTVDEALQFRNYGIKNKILIFSRIEKEWLSIAVKKDFSINISNLNDFSIISEFYNNTNSCPSFHLKFDTGMTRLGFEKKDLKKVLEFLFKNKNLPLEGIYSHFATADEGDLSYALYQLAQFKKIVYKIKEKYSNLTYVHCSNSGAILNIPESYFNTVRVGMLAYGVLPSEEVSMKINLEPVMSFCGSIVNIRRVKIGTQISYGGVYKTKSDTNIAVVQTGFADGFPREWYKKGFVSYKGDYFKIAGRVCMDQLMIDFKNIFPKEGEEVLFFGKKDGNKIEVEEIAKKIHTTPYVLLTAIRGRTERFIF